MDDSTEPGEVMIKDYPTYRTDRDGRSRGGVCMYVRDDIPVPPVVSFSNGMVEVIIVKI